MALTTVLNVDERVRTRYLLPYDTDYTTMVYDNSANVHICNKQNMFVGEIRNCTNEVVATIGGKGQQPSGIGNVRWIWRNDSGKSHEYPSDHSVAVQNMFAGEIRKCTNQGVT